MVRDRDSDFDKGDLRSELKRAGFEDCIAENIADRVDDRKAHGWTYETGRQEAVREAQLIIDSSNTALDNFRGANRDTSANERRYAERDRERPEEREPLHREDRHEEEHRGLFR